MNRTVSAGVVVVLLCLGSALRPAPPAWEQFRLASGQEVRWRTGGPGGLTRLTLLYDGAGAAMDPPAAAGAASLAVHALAGQVEQKLRQGSAAPTGVTVEVGLDDVSLSLAAPASDLSRRVSVLRAALQAPEPPAADLELQRGLALARLEADARRPDLLLRWAWRAWLFSGHGYGRPEHGLSQRLAAVTAEQVATWRRRGVTRLAVTGADWPDGRRELEALLPPLAPGSAAPTPPSPSAPPVVLPLAQRALWITGLGGQQFHAVLGHLGVPCGHPERPAAQVLAAMLTGAPGEGRLRVALAGLRVTVDAEFTCWRDAGLFAVRLSAPTAEMLVAATVLVRQELERLSVAPLRGPEPAAARVWLSGRSALQWSNPAAWATLVFSGSAPDPLPTVAAQDVARATRGLLFPRSLRVVGGAPGAQPPPAELTAAWGPPATREAATVWKGGLDPAR